MLTYFRNSPSGFQELGTPAANPSVENFTMKTPPTTYASVRSNGWSIYHKATVGLFGCLALILSMIIISGIHHKAIDNESDAIITELKNTTSMTARVMPKQQSISSSNSLYAAQLTPRVTTLGNLAFDGHLSYESEGKVYNYTLLNSIGYYSIQETSTQIILKAGCIAPSQIPPLHLIEESFRNAKVIDSATGVTCAGKLLQATFAGEEYVFCKENDSKISAITGADISITMEFSTDPETPTTSRNVVTIPTAPDGLPLVCQAAVDESITPAHEVSSTESIHTRALATVNTHANLWYDAMFTHRRLQVDQPKCGCKGQQRPCLMVHGVGWEESLPMSSEPFGSAFAGIKEHSPCCSSYHYMSMNTVDNAWHSDFLQDAVCDAAAEVTGSTDSSISDLIVVSHSMGNLIISGALASRKCSFDTTVDWISLAAPMAGSRTSDSLLGYCDADGLWEQLPKAVAHLMGRCPATEAYKQVVSQNGDIASEELKNFYVEAQKAYRFHITAAICGTDGYGLLSGDSAGMALLNLLSGNADQADGTVELDSCSIAADATFGNSHKNNPFYQASINHFDCALSNGDGLWGGDRKPVKWFECLL